MIEIKKQYAVFDAKVLSQIPIAGFKKDQNTSSIKLLFTYGGDLFCSDVKF